MAAVLENETAWVRQVHGARGSMMRLLTRRQLQATEAKFAQLHKGVEARRTALLKNLEKGTPSGKQ
jgi:hypothetical protein